MPTYQINSKKLEKIMEVRGYPFFHGKPSAKALYTQLKISPATWFKGLRDGIPTERIFALCYILKTHPSKFLHVGGCKTFREWNETKE